MKILHVIPSLSACHGGPSAAILSIGLAMRTSNWVIHIATTNDDGDGKYLDVPLGEPVDRGGLKCFFFKKQTEFYKCSWPFYYWLKRRIEDYDLIHIHALFSFTSTCAALTARQHGVPYIIRPLGVLSHWGMENRRRYLKALSVYFLERHILEHAAAIQYTSGQEEKEAEATRVHGNHSVVIPLGIDQAPFQNLPDSSEFYGRHLSTGSTPVVLFMSRLDPKKGLDLLLLAFAQLTRRHPRCVLVIAGSGEESFVRGLRDKAARLGIGDRIIWTGFLKGRDKLAALAAATVFTLPSYSENFGISLLEALAAGKACALTDAVGIADAVQEGGAGLVVPCEAVPLASALDRLLSDVALRQKLGDRARQLVERRFSLETMGANLVSLYDTILLRGRTNVAR